MSLRDCQGMEEENGCSNTTQDDSFILPMPGDRAMTEASRQVEGPKATRQLDKTEGRT